MLAQKTKNKPSYICLSNNLPSLAVPFVCCGTSFMKSSLSVKHIHLKMTIVTSHITLQWINMVTKGVTIYSTLPRTVGFS